MTVRATLSPEAVFKGTGSRVCRGPRDAAWMLHIEGTPVADTPASSAGYVAAPCLLPAVPGSRPQRLQSRRLSAA